VTLDEFFSGFLKRPKSEWRTISSNIINQLRNWINESPEVAFLASFLLGLTVALAFKFFICVGFILGLTGWAVYYFAPTE